MALIYDHRKVDGRHWASVPARGIEYQPHILGDEIGKLPDLMGFPLWSVSSYVTHDRNESLF